MLPAGARRHQQPSRAWVLSPFTLPALRDDTESLVSVGVSSGVSWVLVQVRNRAG